MRCFFTVTLFFLIFPLNASGINGNIKGKVSDKSTGEPLAGVYVVYGKNLIVTSREDGTYQISNISGKIIMTFQFIG